MEQRLNEDVRIGSGPTRTVPEELDGLSISPHHTALVFDFDGTLVDTPPTHGGMKLGYRDKTLLDALVRRHHGAVAIVSGRDLRDVERCLDGFTGTISGGHGAETRHDGKTFESIDCDFDRLEQIKDAIMEFAIIDPRAIAEDKTHGMVLQFRQHPYLENKVREYLHQVIADDEDFEILPAELSFEIKPRGLSKATAIERILNFREFEGLNVLYAGDDEAGFALVNEVGGITIKVGGGPTQAQYRTDTPSTLKKWLRIQSGSFDRYS